MSNIFRLITAVLAIAFAPCAKPAQAVTQVFMIQNSGWMEPFYLDPQSPFKALIGAMIDNFTDASDNVALVAFSQSTSSNQSPRLLASGQRGAMDHHRILNKLTVATKGAGQALADTDFREAITETIKGLHGQQAILWVVTNNKNSPNNDADTSRRNREFYDLLHNAAPIPRSLAFPLPVPQTLKGPHYNAVGLMVYALAYGGDADAKLQELVNSGRISRIFRNPPLRLKPLDSDPIAFTAEGAAKDAASKASIHIRGNHLEVEFDVDDKAPTLALRIGMQNIFNPYRIDRAHVSAALAPRGQSATGQALQVVPATVEGLDAGKSMSLDILLPIPVGRIPDLWTFENLKKAGTPMAFSLDMTLTLSGMKLSMPMQFEEEFARIFPADPKPEMLKPPSHEFSSSVTIPVLIRVTYPAYPIYVIGLGGLVGLGGVFYLLSTGRKSRSVRILVDGHEQWVTLQPFGSADISARDGTTAGRVCRRGFGVIAISQQNEGHTLSVIS